MAKVGDKVRYLNAVGGGVITRISGNLAYVDEDGFETPVMLKELVVVQEAGARAMAESVPEKPAEPKMAERAEFRADEPRMPDADDGWRETEAGESLNLALGYIANDLKHLSTTTYDAYIANDSNYYVYITYLTRADGQQGWTTRYAGLIEPSMQVFLGELMADDLNEMDRVAVQFVPFKQGKEFQLKAVACVEHRIDAKKFFKLHCFQSSQFFDEPAIVLPIVRNDMPVRPIEINAIQLEEAMRQKAHADKVSPKTPVPKKAAKTEDTIVVDLHIAELVDTISGMTNADMLNLQIDKFREVMDANLRNHGQKIVFIHGKGEGVLRKALLKELSYRYKGHDVQDASFREFGYGATQVKIK